MISLKGDKKGGLAGDCGATITIAGDGLETNDLALATLAVSGSLSNANITVANGSVGSVGASQMIDSSLFVGFTPTDPSDPFGGGTFAGENHIRTMNINGKVASAFVDSDVIAASVGAVKISSVATNNGGVFFGIKGGTRLSGVTVGSPKFKWLPKVGGDQSAGNFHVVQQ